jgi:hypothetical protein
MILPDEKRLQMALALLERATRQAAAVVGFLVRARVEEERARPLCGNPMVFVPNCAQPASAMP